MYLMNNNPFSEKPERLDCGICSLKELYQKSYDKNAVSPYTKVRIILANGAEYEAVWFSHQFHRHCADNDVRRALAALRRDEQLQQKQLANLKPVSETILETTIGYEQVAVDLTAMLAQREPDPYVKQALDFALLEDFDHLYRYADLLEMEHGIHAERLVGSYTEIMPGRPTIAEHRHPYDDVRRPTAATASPLTKLHVGIITAAEQQTMNYYMNVGGFYSSDLGRQLYAEIAMIEEQHVSHYGSLLNPGMTWLENLLMHEYTEAYVYWSCMQDETDVNVKKIFERHYLQEVAHLHKAAALLREVEGTEWQQVIPAPAFPAPLRFSENKDYIRQVLKTVTLGSDKEDYKTVSSLPKGHDFFRYQSKVVGDAETVASHNVITKNIDEDGIDYRFEEKPHPLHELANRSEDNTDIAR
jgi:hypothetical protein